VLSQEGVDFEVIISDNASSDHTPDVVHEFRDSRCATVETVKISDPLQMGLDVWSWRLEICRISV